MIQRIQKTREALRRGRHFVLYDIWGIGRPGEAVPQGFIIKQIRVAILLISNLGQGTVMLRASALTFATILSIVPFLAVMFYVIQTFNLGESLYASLQDRMERTITTASDYIPGFKDRKDTNDEEEASAEAALAVEYTEVPDWGSTAEEPGPADELVDAEEAGDTEDVLTIAGEPNAGERNRALQNEMLRSFFRRVGSTDDEDYVDPVERLASLADEAARNRSAVSIAGIVLLFTTVFGLMRNIEKSFNGIWGVKRTRSWYRMISDYVMITLLLPFVAAAVLGVTAALRTETVLELLGPLAYGLRGLQYILIIFVFSGLYFMVPNTRVRARYALLGGAVGGILWLVLSWAYVEFQVGVTRYNLVFSTFAQFPVLLMWIYASWMILLFGAELSYAYQNERTFAMERLAEGASYAYREALGLRTMLEVGRRFEAGENGLQPSEAAAEWNVPSRLINEALQNLEDAGLVNECNTDPITYQPARPLERIHAGEVLTALREEGHDPSLFRKDDRYRALFNTLDDTGAVFDRVTLKQLLSEVQLALRPEPEDGSEPAADSGAHAS